MTMVIVMANNFTSHITAPHKEDTAPCRPSCTGTMDVITDVRKDTIFRHSVFLSEVPSDAETDNSKVGGAEQATCVSNQYAR